MCSLGILCILANDSECKRRCMSPPHSPPRLPRLAGHLPLPSKKPNKAGCLWIFFFFVKHSFIKRTSAVYELPFVQITSVIQRYKIRVMHNSRLRGCGGGAGIAFWAEDRKVLERMVKEPWVCKRWLPLPAPLEGSATLRQAGMERGWAAQSLGLPSCHQVPGWAGGSKERAMKAPLSPQLFGRSSQSGGQEL